MSPHDRRSSSTLRACGVGFIVLCAAPFAAAQFSPPQGVNLGVGVAPNTLTGVASGDIDGDGIGDVLGVDSVSGGNIGVARGLAGGAFTAPILSGPLPASTGGGTLPGLGDFNLDGFLDVAVGGLVGGVPTVFVAAANLGVPGAFTLPATSLGLGAPGTLTGLRISDVTGDGELDLVCSVIGINRRVNTVTGGPGITFGGMTSSSTSTGPEDVDICVDVDHDGDKDLVVCGLDQFTNLPVVEVMQGDNAAHFTTLAKVSLPPTFLPLDVNWFDCNQDGFYDVVVAAQNLGGASALFRIGNISSPPFFSSASLGPPTLVANFPTSVLRLEADFDGVEDLSVVSISSPTTSTTSSNFEIFKVQNCGLVAVGSTAVGSVQTQVISQDQFALHSVGDQDGDGREDLFVVDQSGVNDRVLVYRNIGQTDFTVAPVKPLLGQTTPITFHLKAPAALNGSPFVVLMSVKGTQPGVPVGSLLLPLNAPFLPFVLNGTVGVGGEGVITTPPVTFDKKPVGFSLQIDTAALVLSQTVPAKVVYISHPAVITVP